MKYSGDISMIDAIKQLSTDTRRKFLKDIKGHIWEVEIAGGISASVMPVDEQVYEGTIPWAEVAKVEDVRITSPVVFEPEVVTGWGGMKNVKLK